MNKVTGYLQFNKENKNGRIYQIGQLKDSLNEFKEKIDKGTAIGELEHPSSLDISFKNASHVITDMKHIKAKLSRKKKKAFIKNNGRYAYHAWRIQNGGILTTARILDTPAGSIVKQLKDNLTLSPRGIGKINENKEVTEYKLLTFDLINKEDYA